VTPEQVIAATIEGLPDGAYLHSAVTIVSYSFPGEDDDEERGPFLSLRCDEGSGRWVHLGMVESARLDFKRDLSMYEDDDD